MGPVIALPLSNAVTRVVRYGDGGATLERDDDDDALQHPFFDGLREAPEGGVGRRDDPLDVHDDRQPPVPVARPVRAKQIRLRKTGCRSQLAAAERAQNALMAARLAEIADGAGHGGGGGGGGGSDDDDDGWLQAPVNVGVAGRGETAAEKRGECGGERSARTGAPRRRRRGLGAEYSASSRATAGRGLPGATSLSGPGS